MSCPGDFFISLNIYWKSKLLYLFRRIVNRFKRAGYTLDIMRQTACLVFNPIMVENYAALLSCTAVVQASDSMTASGEGLRAVEDPPGSLQATDHSKAVVLV